MLGHLDVISDMLDPPFRKPENSTYNTAKKFKDLKQVKDFA